MLKCQYTKTYQMKNVSITFKKFFDYSKTICLLLIFFLVHHVVFRIDFDNSAFKELKQDNRVLTSSNKVNRLQDVKSNTLLKVNHKL